MKNALLELLEYKKLLSRTSASTVEAIERKRKKIRVVQQTLLQSGRAVNNWTLRGKGHVGTICAS